MEKIAVLADSESLVGFRLAGLAEAVDCTKEDIDAKINAALDRSDVGLIILTQDLLAALPHKTLKRVEASTKPVVLTIPSKGAALAEGGTELAVMVKRAIGVDLSKK